MHAVTEGGHVCATSWGREPPATRASWCRGEVTGDVQLLPTPADDLAPRASGAPAVFETVGLREPGQQRAQRYQQDQSPHFSALVYSGSPPAIPIERDHDPRSRRQHYKRVCAQCGGPKTPDKTANTEAAKQPRKASKRASHNSIYSQHSDLKPEPMQGVFV